MGPGTRMFGRQEFARLLCVAVVIIVFAAMTAFMLKTVLAPGPYRLEPASQTLLTSRLFCPKCLGSNGLELMDYNAVRCKNCGFIFSMGGFWGE